MRQDISDVFGQLGGLGLEDLGWRAWVCARAALQAKDGRPR
jgi:hypothetical protein